jgi:predicted phosphodiesterase
MKSCLFTLVLGLVTGIFAQTTTRFMVVADPHMNSPVPDFQETIFYEIVLEAINKEVDFIFIPGDLIIRGFGDFAPIDSILKDWRFVLDTLNTNGIKLFACRGNNDYSKESWDSLFTGQYAFPQNGPEGEKNITYALEYNNILFIALDQYIELHRINQTWLDSVLTNRQVNHVFVAGHEPAFKLLHTNCMGAYPDERDEFWESLIQAGVRIYFCGHDHFYDHSVIDDGDDDPSNDIHQVIVGTASSLHQNGAFDFDNGRWTPDSLFHAKENGYVLVEIENDDVQLTWKHRVAPHLFDNGGDHIQYLTNLSDGPWITTSFQLDQNQPNPFNSKTIINYELPITNYVNLSIYNILGQKLETLVDGRQPTGKYQVEWDASGFASGIYYYRIEAGEFQDVKKMILLR